ncbi:MAG: zf-TFIIB domain-containing protein [Myxococcales bacterium]|nr:zf-TFIIB domain-containing protein [Myxococcales bacterium]
MQGHPICPACAAPLRAFPPPLAVHGCDACGGFWLGPEVWPLIPTRRLPSPDPPPAADASRSARHCAWCRQPLAAVTVPGPTATTLEHCSQHGLWFDARDLGALGDAQLARNITAVKHDSNPRLDPPEKMLIGSALRSLGMAGGFGIGNVLRKPGNPERVSTNVGVHGGGAVAQLPDGRTEPIFAATSSGRMVRMLLLLTLGLTGFSFAIGYFTVGGLQATLMAIAVAVTMGLGTAMMVGLMAIARRRRIVVDVPNRLLRVYDGADQTMAVPACLILSVRVQLFADPGYADRYDVLANLGFGELWLEQTLEGSEAQQVAQRFAHYLGVPYDPELERKAE